MVHHDDSIADSICKNSQIIASQRGNQQLTVLTAAEILVTFSCTEKIAFFGLFSSTATQSVKT